MDKRQDFIDRFYDQFKKFFPHLTVEEFIDYYDESIYSGYPQEPGGSVWESEGKSIYVLTRIIKPKRVIEIGNFLGRSSNHILQAIEKNGIGEVVLVDLIERLQYEKLHNRNFERVIDDSLNYLATAKLNFDLIIHDGCHEYKHVNKELGLLISRTEVDFYIWSHDWFVDSPPICEVQRAWKNYIDKFEHYEPMIDSISDCGFVIGKFKKK